MPRRHDARLVLWLVTGLVQILLLLTSSRAEAQVVFRASAGGGGEQGPAANAAPPKLAEQPMARMWYSRVTMQDAFAYMRDVSSELGIRQTLFVTPSGAPGRPMEGGGDAEVQLKGTLVYLTKGMVPVPVTISFRRVADEKEFRRLVLESRASFGDAATMVGSGDKYEVRMQVQQLLTSPQPAGEGGEDSQAARPRATIAIRIDSSGGNSGDGDAPRGLPAGDVGQISVLDLSTFYRFHDGIVYESQSPALHTMQLPKTASLTPRATEESLDFFADIDLSQIPRAFREVFWNTVKSQAGTFLQQYDDEPDEEYALRRRTGEFSLELTRAAILDVDRIRLSMKFARDGEPVRLELTVDAREDSNLAQQLGKVSGGVSRFQALRKQPSPLTIASAWQMPDNFVALLKAVFDQGRVRLENELATDAESLLAIEDIFSVLAATVDAGAADAILKLGGDATSGYALYGGLRIQGADELADSLSVLLARLPSTPENDVRVTREDGQQFLSFRLDELHVPGLADNQQLPAQLHFTVADSCLWFSLGGPSSFDTLRTCLQQSRQRSAENVAAAPFVVDIHLSNWLAGEPGAASDAFDQVPMQVLQRFEQGLHRSLANQMSFSIGGPDGTMTTPKMDFRDSYLSQAIRSGRDEFHLEIDTSPRRVVARARIGEGLIRLIVARIMDVQNRAMEGLTIETIEGKDGERTIRVGPPKAEK